MPGPQQPGLPVELRRYLELTPAQEDAILKLVSDYDRLAAEKAQRLLQVQREIGEEMQRETLDVVAIGERYVEIEATRRFMAAELEKMQRTAATMLTAAQKAKIASLEEALKLSVVAGQAQCFGLMPAPAATPPLAPAVPGAVYGFQRTVTMPGYFTPFTTTCGYASPLPSGMVVRQPAP